MNAKPTSIHNSGFTLGGVTCKNIPEQLAGSSCLSLRVLAIPRQQSLAQICNPFANYSQN